MGASPRVLACALLLLLAYGAAFAHGLGWTKVHHADGDLVEVSGLVTADFSGSASDSCCYMQDFDYETMKPGCAGIKLSGFGGFEGMTYGLTATLGTDTNGERYLKYVPGPVFSMYVGTTPALSMSSRCVGGGSLTGCAGPTSGQAGVAGGCGPSNIGLLIHATGRVTCTDHLMQCFYIDDGCGRCDGSGHQGLRVSFADWPAVPQGSVPQPGRFVAVTGISALTTIDGKPCSVVRSRRMGDVQVTGSSLELVSRIDAPDYGK